MLVYWMCCWPLNYLYQKLVSYFALANYGCNCDIMDGVTRSDWGVITDKAQLPIGSVTLLDIGGASTGSFQVDSLRCSQREFGKSNSYFLNSVLWYSRSIVRISTISCNCFNSCINFVSNAEIINIKLDDLLIQNTLIVSNWRLF